MKVSVNDWKDTSDYGNTSMIKMMMFRARANNNQLYKITANKGLLDDYEGKTGSEIPEYILSAIDQKKLMRAKDVIYDKVSGAITSIPCLIYHAGFKKFTLKRCEKRQSTLKSLAPTTSMSKKRKLALDDTAAQGPVPVSHT
jgi:hypothetical protein